MLGFEKWSSCLKHYVFKDKDGKTKTSFSRCMGGWIATLQNQPNGFLQWRKLTKVPWKPILLDDLFYFTVW